MIVVDEEKLSLAIGRGGQNVKLASRLTGWDIKVVSEQQAEEKMEADQQSLHALFKEKLDVDDEVALILSEEGFADIADIAEADESDLLEIDELDEAMVTELQKRAKDAMLKMVLAGEAPSAELMELKGMSVDLAYKLAKQKVCTVEDLAGCANAELMEMVAVELELANQLIMNARKASGMFADEAREPEPEQERK